MNYMLQATVEMGTGTRAELAGWPAGGKTGTSQNFRDAWFIGYTANLTAGVWVGNDTDAPTKHASGANVPAEIWSKFMNKAHQGVPVQQLPGTDLVAYLLGQPQPGAEPGTEAAASAARRRGAGGERAAHARLALRRDRSRAAASSRSRPDKRRGFFQRLFGG